MPPITDRRGASGSAFRLFDWAGRGDARGRLGPTQASPSTPAVSLVKAHPGEQDACYDPSADTSFFNSAGDAVGRSDEIVRAGLPELLSRLWRYALVLSRDSSTAEDLVQATCVRSLERARQFTPGTRLDRWTFAILHSIWLNEVRSRRIREGAGTFDAADVLVFEGAREIEQNILAAQVFNEVQGLPEAQRVTLFLVYVEGLTYREAAEFLRIPIGTVMSRLAAARAKLSALGEERKDENESGPSRHGARR